MICIDLFCGLGGWSEGFMAEGYHCIGFDIEAHDYGTGGYPGELILRDVRSIHGSELKDATALVASPPCQEPSYRAMPWSRAKALNEIGPPHNFIDLFNQCFRIQREASESAGRHIPLIVENVRGAQPWVGKARWNYGSFYLWGDVPALMPRICTASISAPKENGATTVGYLCRCGMRFALDLGKYGCPNCCGDNIARIEQSHRQDEHGTKQAGISGKRNNGKGDKWFQDGAASHESKSLSRKASSATMAKIPLPLSLHIARTFKSGIEQETR